MHVPVDGEKPPENCVARVFAQYDTGWNVLPDETEIAPASVVGYSANANLANTQLDIDAPCETATYGLICVIPLDMRYVGVLPRVSHLFLLILNNI